ncbi:MAG: hypothetical protein DMG90_19850 [Acidobacteria bacterium]|nr:MAG: hypothetical protein DMG90_19850 [Acidobacteriota bacterium]
MIVCRGLLEITQVIVGGCTQKIAYRNFRQQPGADLQRLDSKRVILVLAGRDREIAIRGPQIWLQLNGRHQFLLGLGKFALLE